MRDLEIWRRLVARTATTDDVHAVASLPLARRVAYLGYVLPLAGDEDPAMRAAALRGLAGARGIEAVRAIVAHLDDPEAGVRAAALEALRAVASNAPYRYVHALFHPRLDVRRASLDGDLPARIAELAIYLRGDPEVADLMDKTRWPDGELALAVDFYRDGKLGAPELVERMMHLSRDALRHYLHGAHARSPEVVDTFLEGAARDPTLEPPGYDVLDTVVAAIAGAGATRPAVDRFVAAVVHKQDRTLSRRATVSLLARVAHDPSPELWAACVALEPRVIGYARFDARFAAAACHGLVHHDWPVRTTTAQTERLLSLPAVRADLALAAAVAGLFPAQRLLRLGKALGDDVIVSALVASDHGWYEILRLPPETPAQELAWLHQIAKADYKRYIALAGRALGVLTGKRLDKFIEQLPRRHRAPAYLAAIAA